MYLISDEVRKKGAFKTFHSTIKGVKGTCNVMQLEKALINDRLYVSKVSGKFRIPTIYNFAVIYL